MWDLTKRAAPFGAGGALIGLAGGAGFQALNAGLSMDTAKMGLIGALAMGAIGQVGGMIYITVNEGGGGVPATLVGAAAGAPVGIGYSLIRKKQSVPGTVMKWGALGAGIGGVIGLSYDVIIKWS